MQNVDAVVLIPIKAFHVAKARLSGWLSDDDRERLARFMAERVVRAAGPLPTFVACDDDTVAAWAESLGAEVLWGPGLGLNGAIDSGVDTHHPDIAENLDLALSISTEPYLLMR